MRKITDTKASIVEQDDHKVILLTTLSGQELETRLPMFAAGKTLGVRLSCADQYNYVDLQPDLATYRAAVFVFDNLDGIDIACRYFEGLKQIVCTITDNQLQYLAENNLDHIAVLNTKTQQIERFYFGDTPNRLYKDKAEGQELLKIMARCILEQKAILSNEKKTDALQDVVQFSKVV